ncbi:MAG: septal ring lytic transglycosylase RlpA family protein [Verrucomicrobiota bacterium]
MNPIHAVFLCVGAGLVVGFVSCTHFDPTEPTPEGLWTASWYGEPFHGRKTASGEVYNMHGKTAAHKTLPMGSRLRVTNPKNGRSTIVTINDRGPFVKGRDLDLSYGAAKQIDMIQEGVIPVEVEILGTNRSYTQETNTPAQGHAIQVASFQKERAAQQLKSQLSRDYSSVRIVEAQQSGNTYYRVLVGKFKSPNQAESTLRRLKSAGYSPLLRTYY